MELLGAGRARSSTRRVRVRFNSPGHFALLRKRHDAPRWQSLGRNVQFQLGDTTYDVID